MTNIFQIMDDLEVEGIGIGLTLIEERSLFMYIIFLNCNMNKALM